MALFAVNVRKYCFGNESFSDVLKPNDEIYYTSRRLFDAVHVMGHTVAKLMVRTRTNIVPLHIFPV